MTERGMGITRACGLVGISRSLFAYESKRTGDVALIERMKEMAALKRRYGYRRIHILLRLAELRGLPKSITVDNGPELAGRALDAWAYQVGVKLSFIRPGKPVENACIESFNGKFRDECLNEHWFMSLRQAKSLIEDWRVEYNTERPIARWDT
jgi:transposase InsO family protein